MKKARLAALAASAALFGSEAMESPRLAPTASFKSRVVASFVCQTEPRLYAYKMNDGGLTLLGNGEFTFHDSLCMNDDPIVEEIHSRLSRAFACKVIVANGYDAFDQE